MKRLKTLIICIGFLTAGATTSFADVVTGITFDWNGAQGIWQTVPGYWKIAVTPDGQTSPTGLLNGTNGALTPDDVLLNPEIYYTSVTDFFGWTGGSGSLEVLVRWQSGASTAGNFAVNGAPGTPWTETAGASNLAVEATGLQDSTLICEATIPNPSGGCGWGNADVLRVDIGAPDTTAAFPATLVPEPAAAVLLVILLAVAGVMTWAYRATCGRTTRDVRPTA